MFAEFQATNIHGPRPDNVAKVVSHKTIPFDLSLTMKETMKADHSRRFHLDNGVAILSPPLSSSVVCSHCKIPNSWDAEPTLVKETFLVTPHHCYSDKGIII